MLRVVDRALVNGPHEYEHSFVWFFVFTILRDYYVFTDTITPGLSPPFARTQFKNIITVATEFLFDIIVIRLTKQHARACVCIYILLFHSDVTRYVCRLSVRVLAVRTF